MTTIADVLKRPNASNFIDSNGKLITDPKKGKHLSDTFEYWVRDKKGYFVKKSFTKPSRMPTAPSKISLDKAFPVSDPNLFAVPSIYNKAIAPFASDVGLPISVKGNQLFSFTGDVRADVTQGQLADCYLLAPWQEIFERWTWYRSYCACLLADGSFNVTFRTDPIQIINVDSNVYELQASINKTTGACVIPIMERAAAWALYQTSFLHTLDWGWAGTGMWLLGVEYTGLTSYNPLGTVLTYLMASMASNSPTVLCTGYVADGVVPSSHCLGVVSVTLDPGGDDSKAMVSLRNPWDFFDATVSMQELMTWMTAIISGISAPVIQGDTNGDNKVDLTDLSTVLNNFGTHPAVNGPAGGDIDGNQNVDLTDLATIENNFGKGLS